MDIPSTWISQELSDKIDREAYRTKPLKINLGKKLGFRETEEGIFADFNEPTITEYLSAVICGYTNNNSLLNYSPLLQAVITYRISAYDFIEDKHYYKNGKETFLETRGKDYLIRMMDVYESMRISLSTDLENLGIAQATDISEEQYLKIIQGDKRRNSRNILPLDETIQVQESLAGEPAKHLAYLSGGGGREQTLLFHLVNAICTLEDLMHLLTEVDLTKPKSTIPLAFLNENLPNFFNMSPSNVGKDCAWKNMINYSLDYVNNQLSCFIKGQEFGNLTGLNDFVVDIRKFIGGILNLPDD